MKLKGEKVFLRNYYNILAHGAFKSFSGYNDSVSNSGVFPDEFKEGSLTLKKLTGSLERSTLIPYTSRLSLLPCDYIGMYNSYYYTNSSNYSAIVFGTGNTPVTLDDYKLADQIPSNVINASVSSGDNVRINSVSYDAATGTYTADVSILVTNKLNRDITVREFGFGIYYYLYYREVLEEPFTIPANGVSVFNYQVSVAVPRE